MTLSHHDPTGQVPVRGGGVQVDAADSRVRVDDRGRRSGHQGSPSVWCQLGPRIPGPEGLCKGVVTNLLLGGLQRDKETLQVHISRGKKP